MLHLTGLSPQAYHISLPMPTFFVGLLLIQADMGIMEGLKHLNSEICPNDVNSYCLHPLRPEIIAALARSVARSLKDAQRIRQIVL